MKRINKKGFTLVELLAVIVVLIVIVLISVNVINSRVKLAKKNAVEVNANNYIKAVNTVANLSQNESSDMEYGIYEVKDLNKNGIKLSGTMPKRGFVIISNYDVLSGCLKFDDYKAIITNGKTSSVETGSCNMYADAINFSYTGGIQEFTAPKEGRYQLEAWGAQGGYGGYYGTGGYGGYSTITVKLNQGDKIYVVVGGRGIDATDPNGQISNGGYNGGGYSRADGATVWGSGGGATHFAATSGLLKDTSIYDVILVAGGGGGGGYIGNYNGGGAGGGDVGTEGSGVKPGFGGTQNAGGSSGNSSFGGSGSYGLGGSPIENGAGGGGGGGLYGGGSGYDSGSGSGGGSGYINLSFGEASNAKMYCFYCEENDDPNELTYPTYNFSDAAESEFSKRGDGFARILFVG